MWNESIKILTKEDNYQISQWDQLKLDLDEVTPEELAKKYRCAKTDPRQLVLNILLIAIMVWCIVLGARSTKILAWITGLIAFVMSGYLLYWNNREAGKWTKKN